jgi:RNA polymerase sigma-70 factor (ECF subfamily)
VTREQFIALVTGEQESLRRFLLALCVGHRDDADDIAQEALIKAYMARDKICDNEKFGAWLYRIAYNTFIDHQRSLRTHACIEEAGTLMAENATDAQFEYQDLYAALSNLPPKERTSILLFYLKGYPVREIADIVHGSEAAVRQQLSRGREHLKNIMQR